MNYTDQITNHFTFHDALWLPSWQTHHIPSQLELDNIKKQADKLELIRSILNKPIIIHVWLRPVLNNPQSSYNGQDYNAFVNGATHSAHKIGLATDFHCPDLSCDDVRNILITHLDSLDIRMENKPGSNWVHCDSAPVPAGGHRFFTP